MTPEKNIISVLHILIFSWFVLTIAGCQDKDKASESIISPIKVDELVEDYMAGDEKQKKQQELLDSIGSTQLDTVPQEINRIVLNQILEKYPNITDNRIKLAHPVILGENTARVDYEVLIVKVEFETSDSQKFTWGIKFDCSESQFDIYSVEYVDEDWNYMQRKELIRYE